MLASLLPGIRDVRTPLTVGYLWLLITWLIVGEHVPKSRPSGNGLVAQLFDLGGILGRAAPIAALSFIAYLLGALLTIPVEGRFSGFLSRRIGSYSLHNRWTTNAYFRRQEELYEEAKKRIGANPEFELSDTEMREVYDFGDIPRPYEYASLYLRSNDLRARLLVTNQQTYGEYDRLAAEASFRVNMTLPLMALGLLVTFRFNVFLGLAIMVAAMVLLVQVAGRKNVSDTVLRRAVLDGVIKDPLFEKLEEIVARASGPRRPTS